MKARLDGHLETLDERKMDRDDLGSLLHELATRMDEEEEGPDAR